MRLLPPRDAGDLVHRLLDDRGPGIARRDRRLPAPERRETLRRRRAGAHRPRHSGPRATVRPHLGPRPGPTGNARYTRWRRDRAKARRTPRLAGDPAVPVL